MIPRGPRDPLVVALVLAVLGWEGVRRRWRALLARRRPATLTAAERQLLQQRAPCRAGRATRVTMPLPPETKENRR